MKWIFRYLKGTADYILCYQTPDLCLVGLQRCRLGWWPWWAQVYFRLCFSAKWRGHYM